MRIGYVPMPDETAIKLIEENKWLHPKARRKAILALSHTKTCKSILRDWLESNEKDQVKNFETLKLLSEILFEPWEPFEEGE